jgi:hypothetical protein
MRSPERPYARERSFGLSVGGVLLVIAAVLAWRGRITAAEFLGAVGALLMVSGRFAPAALRWPSAAWWRFAMMLGYVNARIILTVVFVLILTPIGLIWRLIGRDPLARSRDRWSGWVPPPARYRHPDHYMRMY